MPSARGGNSTVRVRPVLERPEGAEFRFGGIVGKRIEANLRNWLLCATRANPAMIEMFYDRDRTPHRHMVPWAGEFAGKYLVSAVQALRITRDPALKAHLKRFVADLIGGQADDGYLGPWPRKLQMTGEGKWDLWGQYHCMLGLYLWYRETGDRKALAACRRCADLFCRTFLDGDARVYDAGSQEMNESSIHIVTLLYQKTGEQRYLEMAKAIERDWETPPSGDYVRCALAGKPFYRCPKPRWESLHGVQAIAELYFITGDRKYCRAFESIWWSIVEGDRHNNGGFTSGERACGNPYDLSAIETCCTVAWMAITQDMLRMSGDPRAADELELSTFNSVLGAQSPSGRWWTYNTPMNGQRKASAHEIVFQARPGQPELNCCSVNAPRGLGILSEWAVMSAEDGVALNYYGPSTFTVRTPSGATLRLKQETDYPLSGDVRLTVSTRSAERFALRLRMPGWSRKTRVSLNGRKVADGKPGTYHVLERSWKSGDVVRLGFDMSPRVWVGERQCRGKVSVYHGPLLLAYDRRFDRYDPTRLPRPDFSREPVRQDGRTRRPQPMLLMRFGTKDGKGITLCDFASAGATGTHYVSWLPAPGLKPAAFRRSNPLRRSAVRKRPVRS